MIGWFLSTFIARRMRAMEFPNQGGPDAGANTRDVLESFLEGADSGVRLHSAAQLKQREQGVPWFRRPFFWEGYGLGLCARHAGTFSKRDPLLAHVGDGYRYMFYTGAGFYNGVAAAEGLPQVPIDRWGGAGAPEFALSRMLIAGGDSFARIAAGREWDSDALSPLLEGQDEDWRRGVWMGAGRALWFLYMRRFEFIARTLNALDPADAELLAGGLGVAITYTQLSEADRIMDDLASLPPRFHRAAQSGVRLCLAAACEDDPRFVERLERFPAPLDRYRREAAASLSAFDREAPNAGARLFEGLMEQSAAVAS